MTFSTAAKILVLGGMANLLWGVVTGVLLARVRQTEPLSPKYLSLTHVGGLMWAPILLSLVIAVQMSDLSADLETTAAGSAVLSSGLLDLKDLLNWHQGVDDEFRTKPLGFWLGWISGPLLGFATLVLSVGVLGAV